MTATGEFAYAELLRRSHPDHGILADCPACQVERNRTAHIDGSECAP